MDYSLLPFLRGGQDVEVAMHADAGKVVNVVPPPWCDTIVVRFFTASAIPPLTPTDTGGFIATGKTAAALVGIDSWFVKSGEIREVQRHECLGAFVLSLACVTAAGIAKVRFERRS